MGSLPCFDNSSAALVINENSPSKHGLVLPIAFSDHCHWVSIPKCQPPASKVTSDCHRLINHRDHLQRLGIWSKAQHGLGFKLLKPVADNHPTNLNRRFANLIPEVFATCDFDLPTLFAIPMLDCYRFRRAFAGDQSRLVRLVIFSLFPPAPALPWSARRGFFIKRRIEALSGNNRHFLFDGSE